MAEKPDDKWALPLCRRDHEDQHRTNELGWWAGKGIVDPFAVAVALYASRPDTRTPRKTITRKRSIPQRDADWPTRPLVSRNELRRT
jgi:hypothetical protein